MIPTLQQGQVGLSILGSAGGDASRASRLLILHSNDSSFADTSTYARSVTLNSTITASTSSPKFGAAAGLVSNANECLLITSNTGMTVGTGAMTIAGWFKPTATLSEKFVLSKGVNENGGWMVGIGTGGVVFRSAGTSDLVYSGAISSSAWTYIKCVFTGTGLKKIFVGGPEVSSGSTASNITTTTRLEVGGCVSVSSSFQFRGGFDEIVISALADLSTTVPTSELADS